MKSLLEKPEAFAGNWHALASRQLAVEGEAEPRPLAPARWDWRDVRRVLVVRLRSIGDTVLATGVPCTSANSELLDWNTLGAFIPVPAFSVSLVSPTADALGSRKYDATDSRGVQADSKTSLRS